MEESGMREILLAGNNPAKVVLLQELSKKSLSAASADLASAIRCLANDSDVAVRFWARKVAASLPPIVANRENASAQNEALPQDILFRRLADAQSHLVANELLGKILARRDPETSGLLFEYLKNCSDPIVISFLVKNLALNFPTGDTVRILEKFLQHHDERVVANCLEGLEHIPSIESAILINRMLIHDNHRVKSAAAKALFRFEPEVAKNAINQMLADKNNPHILIVACHAIGYLKCEDFLPRLMEMIPDPLVGDDALKAATNIGGEVAIGYLEALLATQDPELKQKIAGCIETVKANNQIRAVGQAISAALNEKKKACEAWGKSIIKKVGEISSDALKAGKQRLEHSDINFDSISGAAKIGIKKAKNFDLRLLPLVFTAVLLAYLLLQWVQQPTLSIKKTSKEACIELEAIVSQKGDFGQKLEAFNKDMEVVGKICSPIMKVQPWLNDLEKLQKFEAYDFKFSDYLEKYFPLQTQIFNWAIDGTKQVLEKVGELENFRSQFQASYSDFNAGINDIRRGEFSWQNFDRTASASENLLRVMGSYRKKIGEICSQVKNAENKMLELKAFLQFEKIQETPMLGRLVKSLQSGVDEIVKALQTVQNEINGFKDHFNEENQVLMSINSMVKGLERGDS